MAASMLKVLRTFNAQQLRLPLINKRSPTRQLERAAKLTAERTLKIKIKKKKIGRKSLPASKLAFC